jgi:GTPase Era involved in 16S rRNA processing
MSEVCGGRCNKKIQQKIKTKRTKKKEMLLGKNKKNKKTIGLGRRNVEDCTANEDFLPFHEMARHE